MGSPLAKLLIRCLSSMTCNSEWTWGMEKYGLRSFDICRCACVQKCENKGCRPVVSIQCCFLSLLWWVGIPSHCPWKSLKSMFCQHASSNVFLFFLSPVSDTISSGKKLRNTATLPLSNPPSTWGGGQLNNAEYPWLSFWKGPPLTSWFWFQKSNTKNQQKTELSIHPSWFSPEKRTLSTAMLPSSDKRCVGKHSAVQTSPTPREASKPPRQTEVFQQGHWNSPKFPPWIWCSCFLLEPWERKR